MGDNTIGTLGIDDKIFILKFKHLDVFINLYDDYEKYLELGLGWSKCRPEDLIKKSF